VEKDEENDNFPCDLPSEDERASSQTGSRYRLWQVRAGSCGKAEATTNATKETVGMKQRESAVLVVSDVHVGKKTPSYDMRVAQKVLDEVAKRIVRIAELVQDGYRWDEVVICFLGDVLDGSEIFPGQATVQDIPNVLAQATVAARLFLPIVEASLAVAPIVRLVGVAGNHGRAGKNAAEAANWDIVCYQQRLMSTLSP
jgi:metallophosphoesterase superfamily enzyme